VYPVYLSIKTPLDMDAKADAAQWQKQFPNAGAMHEGGTTNESWYRAAEDALADEGLPMWEGADAMQDGLRAMGFDGITHVGGGRVKSDGVKHRVYIAFDDVQVKSATGNSGAFDPKNPDIRRSAASTGRKPSTPVATVRAAIAERYGRLLEKLEVKGLVTVTQTEEQAMAAAAQARADKNGTRLDVELDGLKRPSDGSAKPADLDIKRSADGTIQGFFDPVTGKAFLVADGLTEQTAGPVLIHEVGVHMANDGKLEPLFERAAGLLKIGPNSAFLNRVRARMAAAGETSGEEAAAYIAEEYERDSASAPGTVTRWLADLTAAVRAWMYQKGVILTADQLTVGDIAAVARANARSLAQDGGAGDAGARSAASGGLSFSNASGNGATPPPGGPPAAPPSAWGQLKARAEGLMSPANVDKFLYEFQDKLIDLKRLRQHIQDIGGTLNDLNDAYLGEELYHKRIAKRTQDFLNDELKPLLAQMRSKGVPLAQLEEFLHARHAPEANLELSFRNPTQQMIDSQKATTQAEVRNLEQALQRAQQQGTALAPIEKALEQARAEVARWRGAQAFSGTEAERLSLSGMSDAKAAAVMAALTPEKRVALDALGKRVDAMNAKTMDALKGYGLMDAKTMDLWARTYQYYVPLHRDEAHPDSASHPVGQGFSVKGDAGKRRAGSNQKVTHILGHIAMQREAALTRGEKNLVGQKLYMMAAQNPDPEWWSVDKPPSRTYVDASTGLAVHGVDPMYKNRPNVVMVRIGGKDAAVVFNERNERAARLAASLKTLDASDMHLVLGWVSKGTRWLASVNTQYNPIFGIINFARDSQAALLGLGTTPLRGQEAQVAKNMLPALRAIYADVRSVRRGGKSGNAGGAWGKLWDDMQMAGGTTGYRDLFADPNERAEALEKVMAEFDRGNASKFAHGIVDWLSDYNDTMEGATRLAAYKVALDSGMSKPQAASLAKNITVNFNRKGRQTREIGALYAFFNAAVQGTARMVQVLRGPTGKKVMLGGVLLGAMNALIGIAMMGGDDEDDPNGWEKIPEFVRQRSLVIPLGREDFVAIPLPLGFNMLPNIGRKAVEMMAGIGDESVGAQLASMLGMFANTFNPLGAPAEASLTQATLMLSPTVIDPVVSLLANKDWTDRPIYRENSNSMDPTPGHLRTRDSASTPAKLVSRWLNDLSGGNAYRPGGISWTPDQLDYVVGVLTGGVGRELIKLNQTVTAPFTGDELPAHKIPLLGRLYGNTRGASVESGPYSDNVREINEIENEFRGRAVARDEFGKFRREEPLVKMIGRGNQAERLVQQLRKLRARATAAGDTERVKELNERIGEVMKEFNRDVRRAKREANE
jgi:hypothetical protein